MEDIIRRAVTARVWCLLFAVGWILASYPAPARSQTQIQYTYDAAGNLVGATRSAAPTADLTLTNLAIGLIVANGDGSFSVTASFTVTNVGTGPANPTWYDRGYLSTNAILSESDQVLSGSNARTTVLAAGASYTATTTFTTSTTTATGTYYLIVKADGGAGTGQFGPGGANVVQESNENNNTQAVAVVLPANPQPDLTVSNLSVGAVTVTQSGVYQIPLTFQVNNLGSTSTSVSWSDRAYLSVDATLDNADQILTGSNAHSTSLAPGASYSVSLTVSTTATTTPGSYTLIVKADGGVQASGQFSPTGSNAVAESNESNNTQSVSISLPVKPDLTVSNLTIGTISVNQSGSYNIPVTFQVNNVGGSAALPTWIDRGYLSADTTLDNADQVLGGSNTRTTNLAAGASYPVSLTFTTTAGTAPGNYTLIVKSDGGSAASGQFSPTGSANVTEASETNNTQSASIALPIRPDLTVTNLTVGTITPRTGGGYNIPVSFQVNNVGGAAAKATWVDRGYLSTDAVLNDTDQILVGNNVRSTDLAAGASYTVNLTFTTSTTTAAGTYTLFVKADGGGATTPGQFAPTGPASVTEADESNNVLSVTVVLP